MTTTDTSVAVATAGPSREPAGSYSQTRAVWQRLRRNRGAVAGLMFLLVLICLAILAPWVAPADPLGIVPVLRPGIANAMIAVGIAAIPTYTRLVRGSVLAAKNNVYVEAARVVGCRTPRILWLHILPNVLAPLIVLATLGAAQAIL